MASYFHQTGFRFDHPSIVEDTQKAIARYGFGQGNHISLVHPRGYEQDVFRSAQTKLGWPRSFPEGMRMTEFTEFDNAMRDGPIHQMYRELDQFMSVFGHKLCRVRIIRLQSNRTYSFHNDEEIRFQYAVITHPNCFFVVSECPRNQQNMPVYPEPKSEYPELHVFRVPPDSHAYLLDANHVHTAINASPIDRFHLVFETLSELNQRWTRAG